MPKFSAGDMKGKTIEGFVVVLRHDTPYKWSINVYRDECLCCKVAREVTHWQLKEAEKEFFNRVNHRRVVFRHNGQKWMSVPWHDINQG